MHIVSCFEQFYLACSSVQSCICCLTKTGLRFFTKEFMEPLCTLFLVPCAHLSISNASYLNGFHVIIPSRLHQLLLKSHRSTVWDGFSFSFFYGLKWFFEATIYSHQVSEVDKPHVHYLPCRLHSKFPSTNSV